jgi:hypothetical protein
MRAKEFIIEASGLRAAKPGETYVDDDGTEYKFQSWNWQFPADADTYPDIASLEAGVLDATGGDKNKIAWVNKPLTRSKSFAFAVFASDDNDEKLIGKFYDRKNPNSTITDTEVKQVLGLSAGTKDKKTSSAVKVDAAMQPGDLGVADNRPRTFNGIVKAVSAHKNAAMLVDSLNAAASGQTVIWQGGAGVAGALQDDFCEVLGPIAMMSGHPQVLGDLAQAVSDVFKGGDIKGASLTFPVDQNNPLVDSYIIKDGITLGVSSKGKQGARATITNIWKAKEEAAQNTTGRAYIAKYTEAVAILDICKDEVGLTQPIILAQRYELITEDEATALYQVIKNPRDPKYQLIGDPKNPNAVIKNPLPADLEKVPPALMRLFRLGGYKSGSYSSFLCLAQTAHLVSKHINTDPQIDFGEAIRSFLNSSAMVQAKSIVGAKGADAVLKSVNVIYPPNFQDKAKIESNGYSGTQVKGKFSFSLPTT